VKLIVGLGNPGSRYSGTRHNAGFLVMDRVAGRLGCTFSSDRHADVARCGDVTLAKPTTFMNRSGVAVQALMTRRGVRPAELVVVHDDLDLPLGRVRVKHGGGAGGQRGVQDVIGAIGAAFARVRVGIGRPPPPWPAERWVLSRFADHEHALVERVADAAADAVQLLVRDGLEAAMNAVNGRDFAVDGAPTGEAEDTEDVPGADGGPSAADPL
jgi:peptidyl-tRNA hydrolase, PTH1 family